MALATAATRTAPESPPRTLRMSGGARSCGRSAPIGAAAARPLASLPSARSRWPSPSSAARWRASA
eukprot:402680-Prymnesium_polylepis.1